MTDINGAHVTELAVRLQKFFANQQQVSGRLVDNLSGALQHANDLHTEWSGLGFTRPVQQLEVLMDELIQIAFACRTVRETAPAAEQDLLELLALVGVELGGSSMHADEFLTLPELAARLHLHKRVLLRLVHAGELPHKRIGKQFRFRWRDIEAWWGASEHPATLPATRPDARRIQAASTDTSGEVVPLVRGHKRCKVAPHVP